MKILDLGLARFFNDDQDLITKQYDETVLGTADYLARAGDRQPYCRWPGGHYSLGRDILFPSNGSASVR